MLDGIDDIQWSRLGHAYGSAADVPDQIRALRSPEQPVRQQALNALFGNIFHQGTRYQASAYAVPFLLELLADPDTPEPDWLLTLLTSLAIGYDESFLPDGFPVGECRQAARGGRELLAAKPPPWVGEDEDEDDKEYVEYEYVESLSAADQDRLWTYVALAVYDAVRAGVPLFRSLLDHSDPGVRAGAAYALGWFPEEAAGSLPALTALIAGGGRAERVGGVDAERPDGADFEPSDGAEVERPDGADFEPSGGADFEPSGGAEFEPSGGVRRTPAEVATAVVAAGLLGAAPYAGLLADPRPVVRWAAAVGRARVLGAEVDAATVDELLRWLAVTPAGSPHRPETDGHVPFLDGDLGGYAALALRQLGPAYADRAFDALLDRLPAVSGTEALPVATEALRTAFPAGAPPTGAPVAELLPDQRRLVEVLARSPRPWLIGESVFGNFSSLLRGYGLPADRDAMRAYLADSVGVAGGGPG
ncbi:HEAT repeat domain-containing protein [Micromonospora sp. WMMA1923]|uniref:HEAT repeat domain-containing protein n=1 Tax=Micromonospora sp. WMMA1923 TaxID=3404125 RepID=UPI003B9357B1